MASLSQLKAKFQSLRGREIDLAAEAIDTAGEFAAQLNAAQLAQGIKADGSKANFTYAPVTIAQKQGKPGLAGVTDRLTNYDTGESYAKLYEKVSGNKVIFGTGSDKEDAISERMDGEAFGLTRDSKADFLHDQVAPDFARRVRQFVGL